MEKFNACGLPPSALSVDFIGPATWLCCAACTFLPLLRSMLCLPVLSPADAAHLLINSG